MSFTIDKHIPVPTKRGTVLEGITETLRALSVGDSFLIKGGAQKDRANVYGAATRLRIKVATRVENKTGLRIWRTE